MAQSQFGTNANTRRKRVLYTETGTTIREGMPVCYEFDATANILGYDKGNNVKGSTTAEGNQNEGKFMRVEDPDADNIHAFAGVVAGASYDGLSGKERWLDIYIPNGAIVPCRVNQNCVVGSTILAVHTGEQALTAPHEVAGRAIAIAWETVDRSGGSSDGLCLCKLSDTLFIYQKGDAVRLEVDNEDTGNMMVNQIIVGTSQASGLFSALQIKAYQTAGNAESWDYGLALNVSGDFSAGTITSNANVSGHWLNLGAVTISAGSHVSALRAGIYEGGNTTFTDCSSLAPLSLAVQVATNPGTNNFAMIYCRSDGAIDPDVFLFAENAASVAQNNDGGGVGGANTCALLIEIRIGGTQYWIPTYTAAELTG